MPAASPWPARGCAASATRTRQGPKLFDPGLNATTDALGRFEVKIREGWYYVLVTQGMQALPTNMLRLHLKGGETVEMPPVSLVPGASVSGVVVSKETGKPIEDARLVLGYGHTARTDKTGRFKIEGVRPGRQTAVVMAEGMAHQTVTAQAAIAQPAELRVEMSAGFVIKGRVLDQLGRPAWRVVVRTRHSGNLIQGCLFACMTDREGRYELQGFPLDTPVKELSIYHPFLVKKTCEDLPPPAEGRVLALDLRTTEGLGVSGVVQDEEGKPIGNMWVHFKTGAPHIEHFGPVVADAKGRFHLRAMRTDAQGAVYVRLDDGRFGCALATPARGDAIPRITLTARKGRDVPVVLRDPQGAAVAGHVEVRLTIVAGLIVSSTFAAVRGGDRPTVLKGLLPGYDYFILAHAPGGLARADQRHGLTWRFEKDDPDPRIAVLVNPLPRRAMHLVAPSPDPAKFARDVATLKDAVWKKADSVEQHLTWHGVSNGVVLVDTNARVVRRFQGIVGIPKLTPTAVAFGPRRVWLGTDKGLLAWHREGGFWSRFAVGGLYPDLPIELLALKGDALDVTLRAGARKRIFRFSLTTETWRPADKQE